MRKISLTLTSLALMAGAACAAEAPRTVGDYGNAMNAVAEKLDLALAQRQRAADAAGAQRLGLVAAMIRRASAEFRSAEQAHIVEDADTLPAPVKAKLDAAFARTREAESRAAGEPRFVDEAHATFNALIDALPVKTPHPTFYGLLSNDLTDPQGRLAADVVVYGDRLIDPLYDISPTVQFGGEDLPASALKSTSGRIEITLPTQVKAAVRFSPAPCEQRPSFGLRVHDVYAQAHGPFWPLVWHTRVETNADFYALASPVVFAARIEAAVETPATKATVQDFRRRSDFAIADCEQTKTVKVEIAAPEGASDVACKAVWTDAAGQTATSGRCERHGATLSATGVLTGPAKVCSPDKLCSCSERAQGFLEISGTYRAPEAASDLTPVAGLAPLDFPAGGLVRRALPFERLRQIKLDVARRDCAIDADTLEITLGQEVSGAAVSKTGAFRAIYAGGELSVGAAEAFAPEVGKAP
jgi:hypothetical protein